ncbi:hypothetical protein A3715_30885 [Oleiphilus sp. HI0009]|nr:hypothetical protein A3715_19265 [Oleiphilus sp. HI0009]KZX83975.1 hypothetical protein A3715_30885 [Oleiphilus sp. HI0009]
MFEEVIALNKKELELRKLEIEGQSIDSEWKHFAEKTARIEQEFVERNNKHQAQLRYAESELNRAKENAKDALEALADIDIVVDTRDCCDDALPALGDELQRDCLLQLLFDSSGTKYMHKPYQPVLCCETHKIERERGKHKNGYLLDQPVLIDLNASKLGEYSKIILKECFGRKFEELEAKKIAYFRCEF